MRFTEARPKALELARADTRDAQDSEKGKKRKIDETEIEDDESVRNTRSRQTRSSKSKPHAVDNEAPIEVPDSEGDDADFVPEGMAKCPICNKSMKAEQVYNHLDVCTGPDSSQGRSTRSKCVQHDIILLNLWLTKVAPGTKAHSLPHYKDDRKSRLHPQHAYPNSIMPCLRRPRCERSCKNWAYQTGAARS